MTGTTRTTDPFGSTSDPATYLPREASEAVLSALVSFLRVGATQLAVQGPAGIGKTMMLRLIETRLEGELRSVYVPHPTLPADEMVPWILGLLDEPFAKDPDGALIELARRLEKGGSGLVLLIDDAGSMPAETLRHLAGLAMEGHPALHLVFALPDDSRAERAIAAIPPGIAIVPFMTPMSVDETAEYVGARLARAQVRPEILAGFDAAAMASIHDQAEGLPQLVNHHAMRCLIRLEAGEQAVSPRSEESRERDEGGEVSAALDASLEDPTSESRPEEERADRRRWARSAAAAFVVALAIAAAYLAGRLSQPGELGPSTARPATVEGPSRSVPFGDPRESSEATAESVVERAEEALSPDSPETMGALTATADGPELAAPVTPSAGEVQALDAPEVQDSGAMDAAQDATVAVEEIPPAPSAGESVSRGEAASDAPIPVVIRAPPGARIEVDAEELGVTPLGDLKLAPGAHWFRATLPNGRVVERMEEVDSSRAQIDLR